MRIILFLVGGLIQLLQADNNQLLCDPFAARLSLGYYYSDKQNSSDMIDISFNTNYSCPNAFIKVWQNIPQSSNITYSIGISDLLNMSAIYTNYSYPYNYSYFTYIQTVQLGNLVEGQLYYYEIYGNASLKPLGPFNFRPPYRNASKQQRIIFFGDMDSNWLGPNASGPTLNWFQNQIAQNLTNYDLAVFNGDMAYDLEGDNCMRGDFWLRNISIFTQYIPLLVMPGNHDKGNNSQFPMIRKMFRSPEKAELNTKESYYNFFNWNLGLAQFISFNPYWILYNKSTPEQRTIIYNQMELALTTANNSRDQVPWLIITSHYPMYCSDSTNPQCGTNWLTLQNYTKLFAKFKVDMYIAAHQHDYERDKPTVDNVTAEYASADSGHAIINSTAPLYIVDGSAGNNYYMPPQIYAIQSFTQEQSVNVSIGILTIQNRTHLYWEQRDSASNQLLDYVFLIKPDSQVNANSQTSDLFYKQWWFILIMVVVSLCIVGGVVSIAIHFWKKGKNSKSNVYENQSQGDASSLQKMQSA